MKTRRHDPLNDVPRRKGIQWSKLLVKQAHPGGKYCEYVPTDTPGTGIVSTVSTSIAFIL